MLTKEPYRYACVKCGSVGLTKRRESQGVRHEPKTKVSCDNCGESARKVYDKKKGHLVNWQEFTPI